MNDSSFIANGVDSSIHRRYGGLGLSIANTLIEAHGGTLEAASEGLDKGATFTARFKIDDSATEAGGDERPAAAKDAGLYAMAA